MATHFFWGNFTPNVWGNDPNLKHIFWKIGWFNHLEKLPLREVVGLADLLETAKLQRCLENAKAWCQNAKVKNLSEASWPGRVGGWPGLRSWKVAGRLKVFFSRLKNRRETELWKVLNFFRGLCGKFRCYVTVAKGSYVELVGMTKKHHNPYRSSTN